MPGKPRCYLFYGSDARASLQAVARWRRLFEEKHGSFASFRIDADELSPDQFSRELEGCLQGDTLFREPRLLVLRRLTSQEKGNSLPYTKALLKALERPAWRDDPDLTVAVWEERDLPAGHPLAAFFAALEGDGAAKSYRFAVPSAAGVAAAARSWAEKQGLEVEPEALRWLSQQHAWIEKHARLEKRLKPGEPWPDDYRGWWLHCLLEGAALRSRNGLISLEGLRAGHRDWGEPVGAFDIAEAVSAGSWGQARGLALRYAAEAADPGDYFSLFAALRWRLQRRTSLKPGRAEQAVRWLAEAEVAAKNGVTEPSWLLSLLIARLEAGSRDPLLPYRTLWLSQLPRSN